MPNVSNPLVVVILVLVKMVTNPWEGFARVRIL